MLKSSYQNEFKNFLEATDVSILGVWYNIMMSFALDELQKNAWLEINSKY